MPPSGHQAPSLLEPGDVQSYNSRLIASYNAQLKPARILCCTLRTWWHFDASLHQFACAASVGGSSPVITFVECWSGHKYVLCRPVSFIVDLFES